MSADRVGHAIPCGDECAGVSYALVELAGGMSTANRAIVANPCLPRATAEGPLLRARHETVGGTQGHAGRNDDATLAPIIL